MRKCFDMESADHNIVVRQGLTLDEAQAHTSDSRSGGDGFMDVYYRGEPSRPSSEPTVTTPLPLELRGDGDL
jgi:hypothetical protein